MTKIEKVEGEIKKLNHSELALFRNWFQDFDSEEWDRQIEKDIRAGKLDKIAERALTAHRAGRSKEL